MSDDRWANVDKLVERNRATSRAIRRAAAPDPPASEDAVDRLRHTLYCFPSQEEGNDDRDYAIVATSGIYGEGVRTGPTWGDLREILRRLEPS